MTHIHADNIGLRAELLGICTRFRVGAIMRWLILASFIISDCLLFCAPLAAFLGESKLLTATLSLRLLFGKFLLFFGLALCSGSADWS